MKNQEDSNFFWGAATASYQVEGGIDNCDWAAAARDGRVPACGRACDHYNRYEEDFDLAVELGHTAHRFSLEWARIEPEEGKYDMDAVKHYRHVIQALRARNLEPIMTLWHFTLPEWFARRGGFEHADAAKVFARYAAFCTRELGEDVTHITTINEPMVFLDLGWRKGNWPPFKKFSIADGLTMTKSGDEAQNRPDDSLLHVFTYVKVLRHLAAAHNRAYVAIKAVRPKASVSLVKHTIAYDHNGQLWPRLRAWAQDYFFNHTFLRMVMDNCDAIGLNFYHYVQFGAPDNPRKTDMGWNYAPEGIYHALKTLARYQKPIFVSEAGIANHDDSMRAEYIEKQVAATLRARADGVDVRGHLYWSLMDNYEWALGFEKRFGLIEIHYDDNCRREIRPSAWVYKELIEKHSAVD
jgi:beta-glucosidase